MTENNDSQELIEEEVENGSLVKYYGLSGKKRKANDRSITDFVQINKEMGIGKCMKCQKEYVKRNNNH